MDIEVLTTSQLAKILKVSTRTIINYAHNKTIPGSFKIRNQWRFDSQAVKQWIEDQKERRSK